MSQTFLDWDATAGNNTTVGTGAIDIDEGCAPGNVNDALREIMAAAVRSAGLAGLQGSGSRPAGTQTNQFWTDVADSANPVIYWYDGTDDIAFATISASGNTITLSGAVAVSAFDITGLTALTAPAAADAIPIYDDSAAGNRKILPEDFLKIINVITAETAPAIADEIAIYDASATDSRKMTLANLLKVINGLTADATPDAAADYVVTYDASATAAKKVLISNLAAGWAHVSTQEPTSNVNAISLTGLSSYRHVKGFALFETDGTAVVSLQARVSAGTWRTIESYTPLGSARAHAIAFDLSNFNTAKPKGGFSALQVFDGAGLTRDDKASKSVSGDGMVINAEEVWDEVQIITTDLIMGATASERAIMTVFGSG